MWCDMIVRKDRRRDPLNDYMVSFVSSPSPSPISMVGHLSTQSSIFRCQKLRFTVFFRQSLRGGQRSRNERLLSFSYVLKLIHDFNKSFKP